MRTIFSTFVGLLIVIAFGSSSAAQTRRWGEGYLPNLPVVTQDGRTVRFYDDLIKGKMVIVSFIFTSCKDLCPLTTARLAEVVDKLGDVVGRDIFLVSMTVDPETDTPERLKTFADAFHVGRGWTFVTGPPADIKTINSKFGEQMRSLNDHRNEILLGNDATGEWMRNSVFGDLNSLVEEIRDMDPKWRNRDRAPENNPGIDRVYPLSDQPGQVLFTKLCSACHAIGGGDRVGPDLLGVVARRDRAWLSRFVANPEKMIAEEDAIAIDLLAKYNGVRMPNLGLSENDVDDLIAYIRAQSERADQQSRP